MHNPTFPYPETHLLATHEATIAVARTHFGNQRRLQMLQLRLTLLRLQLRL